MGTVTIRNYCFPINFSYKGWSVNITDETSFFGMKDLKVRVRMTVDSEKISRNIAHSFAQFIKFKEKQKWGTGLYGVNSMQEDPEVYNREYKRILTLATEFAGRKGTVDYTLANNGSVLDRFFGQNISAIEKMCQKVVENIDTIYGNVEDEFIKTLK